MPCSAHYFFCSAYPPHRRLCLFVEWYTYVLPCSYASYTSHRSRLQPQPYMDMYRSPGSLAITGQEYDYPPGRMFDGLPDMTDVVNQTWCVLPHVTVPLRGMAD